VYPPPLSNFSLAYFKHQIHPPTPTPPPGPPSLCDFNPCSQENSATSCLYLGTNVSCSVSFPRKLAFDIWSSLFYQMIPCSRNFWHGLSNEGEIFRTEDLFPNLRNHTICGLHTWNMHELGPFLGFFSWSNREWKWSTSENHASIAKQWKEHTKVHEILPPT
jgi:hypothetical protein